MNIAEIKCLIDSVEVVCFDVFDTIVSRKCYPDYTKSLFCKFINSIFNLKISDSELLSIRLNCENELYKMNKQIYSDAEFKYESLIEKIYLELKKRNLISVVYADFYKCCETVEINIEKKVQYLQPKTMELFKYCQKNNKKIVCVSDMYLSEKMLLEIFHYYKIDKYIDEIYVSSEFIKSKRTGNLYKKVIEDYKLNPNKFLMIGDNEHSDYNVPKSLGLNSFRINHHGVEHFYEKNKIDVNDTSYIKELSYLIKSKSFKNEYKIYKFIKNIYFKCIFNNIETVNINSDLILKYFKEFKREIFIYDNIHFESKKNNLKIDCDNNKLVANYNNETIICDCNLTNLDLNVFRDIVRLFQNRLDEDSLLSKAVIIKEKDTFSDLTDKEKLKLRNVGISYSPLFYKFIDWILDDCQNKNIDKIYFFTREGEFFYQIASKIDKYKNIDKYVLEVSRLATFCPSIRNVTIDEMMRVWNQYYIQSMRTFCKTLGLNIDDFIEVFERHGLSLNESILFPNNDDRVKQLFEDNDFIDIMSKKIEEKKENILKYFKNKKLDNSNGKVAIVDIGWRGTIQDNICYLLSNKEIYGYYFGLHEYFNIQPKNSYKLGFLNQYNNGIKFLENVTPIEMLCNSPYGSTIGYTSGKKVEAIRQIDEKENQSYDKCTKYIQEGIIENIINLQDKEIFDNDILKILNDIVFNPTKEVAKMYFKLKHNEEFGLGKYVNKDGKFKYTNLLLAPISTKYRNRFRQSIIDSTWNQGYLKVNGLGFLNNHYKKKISNFSKVGKKSIAWFLPPVIKGSGGHRTIIQNANALVKAGYSCDLYFDEDYFSTSESMKQTLISYFQECLCDVYIGSVLRKKYDLVFATHAILTADYVRNCDCSNKAYFIQDFEPWFMPMGELYINMEKTYNYGFKGVSIGRWLAYKIYNEYNTKMRYFNFCADLKIYKPLKDVEKEDAICFIYQPEKSRRCPNLGIDALRLVKKLRPEVKIYLYGSYSDTDRLECENLHIINLNKCNELYNKCRVGLCISASNPSRIPFEMMASGLPVVDLYRENNLYDMPDGGVLLAQSTPEAIATALIRIYDDRKLADSMSKFGQKFMKDYPLEKGFEQFVDAVDNMFGDEYETNSKVDKIYTSNPVAASPEVLKNISLIDFKPEVKNTSDMVRKMVKVKKKTKQSIKKIVRKVFRI